MNYIKIWKEVIQRPSDFYSKMPTTGGPADPLIFAVINYLLYGFLIALFDREMMDGIYGGNFRLSLFTIIFTAIMALLFGIFSTSLVAVIYDAIYKLLGGTGNYQGTVRFIYYTSAVLVVSWIPIIGWVAVFYGIYLYIVGGMFVHKVSMGKSAIAVFLPILVFFLMGVIGSLEG